MWIKKQLVKLLIWLTEDAIKQKVNNFIRADKDLRKKEPNENTAKDSKNIRIIFSDLVALIFLIIG